MRIHQHAVVGVDAGAFQEVDVGPHARRRDDQIGGQRVAVVEPDRQRLAGVDGLDLRRGEYFYALVLAPRLDKAAGDGVHHARHHAVFHFNDGQIGAARRQRLQDDAADEPGAHEHHPGARPGALHDVAGVLQRPAGVHAGGVDTGHRRRYRA